MRFHQSTHAEFVTNADVIAYRFGVQQRAEDCIRTEHLCLIDLVLVHCKILADRRTGDDLSNLFKYLVRAEEPVRLGQTGNAVRTGVLIAARDGFKVKYRVDDALGRARLFHLADKRAVLPCQRLLEAEIALRHGFRLRFYIRERCFRLICRDPFPGESGQFVENHAFAASCVAAAN